MALYKSIRQPDGVTTSYHRILYIQNTLNEQTSIAVVSYVDDAARTTELSSEDEIAISPYKVAVTYEKTYDESITPDKAYDYLKTLPEFEGAEDI